MKKLLIICSTISMLMAQGEIGSLDEARQVVRNSTEIVSYTPTDQAAWDEAYGRFQRVLAK